MGYGDLNLPFDVPANEFLLLKGEQFSKSRGVAVWLEDCLSKYSVDEIRYYIAATMPERHDTDFSWQNFKIKINTDLADTVGNFAHRVLSFAYKYFGKIPDLDTEKLGQIDYDALDKIKYTYENTVQSLNKCEFKNALETIIGLSSYGNKYIYEKAPWHKVKEEYKDAKNTIYICMRYLKTLALLLAPFLPESSEKLWHLIGYDDSVHTHKLAECNEPLLPEKELAKPFVLFKKLQ
jgi:methionyl-tRNA synthetase